MNRLFEAIANDEVLSVRGAELGITWRKVSEYLGPFCFLYRARAEHLARLHAFVKTRLR